MAPRPRVRVLVLGAAWRTACDTGAGRPVQVDGAALFVADRHELIVEGPPRPPRPFTSDRPRPPSAVLADVLVACSGARLGVHAEVVALARLHGVPRLVILHVGVGTAAAERRTREELVGLGLAGDEALVIALRDKGAAARSRREATDRLVAQLDAMATPRAADGFLMVGWGWDAARQRDQSGLAGHVVWGRCDGEMACTVLGEGAKEARASFYREARAGEIAVAAGEGGRVVTTARVRAAKNLIVEPAPAPGPLRVFSKSGGAARAIARPASNGCAELALEQAVFVADDEVVCLLPASVHARVVASS